MTTTRGVPQTARAWTGTWWATSPTSAANSFGLVAYRMADLVLPVAEYEPVVKPADQPEGVCATADVTKPSAKQGGVGACRPVTVG